MSKENKSRYALLGMLSLQPMSGYDLKKFTEESTANFWQENYAQIYPILRQLTDTIPFFNKKNQRGTVMSNAQVEQMPMKGMNIRGILLSLVLNVAIPLLLYNICKTRFHTTEVAALSVAAIFPICDSIFEVIWHRQFDVIAIISLLGSLVGIIGVLLGGDAKLLLIRESFFTGALGLACFISFLLPRPLMFYFARQMMAGKDQVKLAAFNEQWKKPQARFVHRLITFVWGCAFLAEFLVRVALVYMLPTALVLAVAPIVTTGIVVVTMLWTFAYARRVAQRVRERQQLETPPQSQSPA